MKHLFFLLSFFPIIVSGQNFFSAMAKPSREERTSLANFSTISLNSNNPIAVEYYLKNNFENLKSKDISLQLLHNIESKAGQHFTFIQLYKNTPVYDAQIKVNMDKQGNIKSTFDNSYNISSALSSEFPAENIIEAFLKNTCNIEKVKTERNYFNIEQTFVPACKIRVSKTNLESYEVILDASGNILLRKDLNSYYGQQAKDTIVSALVFLPDPLTTAGIAYGSPYLDSDDADITQLNAQRKSVQITVEYLNDTFRLQNQYAAIKEFSNPVSMPAYCAGTPNFNYTRSQNEFEDVNAYFHINVFQKHVQSLGFNLVNYPIWIDTHANNGQDNSMFSPGYDPPRLSFGEGGVDDAEDADVIIHEYGHAISHSAAPDTKNGNERETLDEAIGDYLAASYSRSINPFKWENIFSWDGHNTFWNGRTVVSTKHYPEDLKTPSNKYGDADMWSATIMEIWGDLGRKTTDELLIESLYGYASNMTMKQAALLFIQADSALNGGMNYPSICNRFYNRGLTQKCWVGLPELSNAKFIELFNSAGFAQGEKAKIMFKELSSSFVKLIDIQGKIILEANISMADTYEISGKDLAQGIYILNIITPAESVSFKLIKL